jgi:hypothetical protein
MKSRTNIWARSWVALVVSAVVWCVGIRTASADSWGLTDWAPQSAACQLWPSGNIINVHTWTDGSISWNYATGLYPAANWIGGPGSATSAPSCVSLGDDMAYIFIRGDNKGLWVRTTAAGSYWQHLGGILSSAPSAAGYLPGRIEIFMDGTDHAVWRARLDTTQMRVVLWESLGGYATSAPAAVMPSRGEIHVFMRTTDNTLRWATWMDSWGAWSTWDPLDGTVSGQPVVASEGNGQMVLAVVRYDGNMWYRRWTFPTTWTPWTRDPSANQPGAFKVDSLGITRIDGSTYEVFGYTANPVKYAWLGSYSSFSTYLRF